MAFSDDFVYDPKLSEEENQDLYFEYIIERRNPDFYDRYVFNNYDIDYDDNFDRRLANLSLCESYDDLWSGTHITDLNSDCLRHLLSFLPFDSLIKLRRVCTQFKAAVDHFLSFKRRLKIVNQIGNQNMIVIMTSKTKEADLSPIICNHPQPMLVLVDKVCPRLQSLDLIYLFMHNRVVDSLVQRFYQLTELCLAHPINLSHDNIELIAQHFGPHLKNLTVSDADLREESLEKLVIGCTNLESLDVSGNPDITGQCFHHLNSNLLCLRLSQCDSVREPGLRSIVKSEAALSLQEIVISGVISDYMIAIICENVAKLKSFECVYGCTRELDSDEDHLSVIGRLSQLERLSLQEIDAYFGSLDDSSLINIMNSCGRLKYLEMHIGSGERLLMTDKYLSRLHEYCPLIQSLKLYNFEAVSDKSLNSFSKLSNLKELELINLYSITDEGVAIVTERCAQLTTLSVYFDGTSAAITNLSLTACIQMCRSRPKHTIEVNFFETSIAVPHNVIIPANMRLRVSWYRPTPEGRRYTEIKLPEDKPIADF